MKKWLFIGFVFSLVACKKDSSTSTLDFRFVNSSNKAMKLHVKQVYIHHDNSWNPLLTKDTLIYVGTNQSSLSSFFVPKTTHPSADIDQIRIELADTNYWVQGETPMAIQSPNSTGTILVQLWANVKMKKDLTYRFSVDINAAQSIDTAQLYFNPYFTLSNVLEE